MAGMTVRVAGTDKSAVVGSGGDFQVNDVPAGKVELQFKSESVNASTTLSNVGKNQYIQIQVQVTATTAVVVGDTREGKVYALPLRGQRQLPLDQRERERRGLTPRARRRQGGRSGSWSAAEVLR